MARTEKEIVSSLSKDITSINSSIDVKKGPIYNFYIAPAAPVISEVEESTDRIERLLSLDMVNASENDEDISAFGNNFKVARGGGEKERHLQTFYMFSKPNYTINIPIGSLVSSSEGTYIYKVLTGGSFQPESAESYYNSNTGRYELNLMVEAVNYGASYNLPKGRVNTIVSNLNIDGTISATDSIILGTEAETNSAYMAKVERRLEGLNSGTASGIKYTINEFMGIEDSNVFKPGDDVFTRKVKRAALDIYVNRFNKACRVQTTVVEYDTDKIYLEEVPVLEVESVVIYGKSVPFVFNADTDIDTAGSSISKDYVTFDSVPSGTTVTITYYINNDVPATLSLFQEKDLYESDVVVRQPFVKNLIIKVIVKTNTSNKEDAREQAEEAIQNYPSFTMSEVLCPIDLEQKLQKTVPNIINVYIISHCLEGRKENFVSTVNLLPNEIVNVVGTIEVL